MRLKPLAFGPLAALALFAVPALAADAAPGEVARAYDSEYRTDTATLQLAASGEEGNELEYHVRMKAGSTLVYAWSVTDVPAELFYTDFHGEADARPPAPEVSYREGLGTAAQGSLVAPFDGLHGWLFKNDSLKPVTVKLTVAGFYDQLSLREAMGIAGPEYLPFGPADWPDRYGPVQKR
ncbi:MAG TPA: hypothetical protein VL460_01710 [Caulobacteraceae bacterium]|nr:hypothetical protein [Caulobacteraceae bacterium]